MTRGAPWTPHVPVRTWPESWDGGRARLSLARVRREFADDRRAVSLKVTLLLVCLLVAAVLEVPRPW
jgi:DNA-binding transcriptional regulator PaaX